MPLIVATAGVADANSYTELAAAVVVAAMYPEGAAFIALATDAKREQCCIRATTEIDSALLSTGRLTGTPATTTQALLFPRDGTSTLPLTLVLATRIRAFELAERLSLGEIGTAVADTSNVKKEVVDVLETEYFAPGQLATTAFARLSETVRGLLERFLRAATTGYGSSAVTRGS